MYCVRGVLCVFSQCAAKGRSVSEVSAVNGGRGTPSTAGRRLPPLRALRQNAPGARRDWGGLKALSPVHCLRVAPGFLATRSDCSEPARRGKKAQRRLYSSADVQRRGSRWETKMAADVRSHVISGRLIVGTRSSDVLFTCVGSLHERTSALKLNVCSRISHISIL